MPSDDVITQAISNANNPESAGDNQQQPAPEKTQEQKQEEMNNALRKEEGQEGQEGKEEVTREKETQPEPEPEPEPKISARERFSQRAEKERETRGREQLLKDRLEEAEKTVEAFKEYQKDPLAYLERTDPGAYERWTKKMLARIDDDEQRPGQGSNAEIVELKQQIANLTNLVKQQSEAVQNTAGQAEYRNYMNQVDRILADSSFDPVRKWATEYHDINGEKTDYHEVATNIWTDFRKRYPHAKPLSPREVCEVMRDDAEEKLSRLHKKYSRLETSSSIENEPAGQVENKPTLTNDLESSSEAALGEDWWAKGLSKDEVMRKVASTIQFDGNTKT
jgi:hypothetical protein